MADGMAAEPTGGGRQHYWDATRAALMLLGLPYHAAMLYDPGGWIVAVGATSAALGHLAAFIHLFRMPAFFVVAGFFAALLLERRAPGTWLRARVVRLGVPLLAGLVTLVPPMNYLGELAGRDPAAAAAEWTHQTLTSGGYWVRHLWFLIVLLYLNTGAAAVAASFPKVAVARLGLRVDWLAARMLPLVVALLGLAIGLYEAAALAAFERAGLATNLVQQILRLDDLLVALPFFALGALLQRSPQMLEAFGRPSPTIMILAAGLVLHALLRGPAASPALARFTSAIAAVAMTQVVVSLARATLDRPSRMVARLVDGSFVIYLFHLPILIGLFVAAKRMGLPPLAGFVAILALTFTLCWAVLRVVERSAPLRLLYDGRLSARR